MRPPPFPTSTVLTAFGIALVVSGILAVPLLNFLIKLKSRQTISAHVPEHAAKQGTPTMGGLIIVAGFLAASIYLWLPLDGIESPAAAAVLILVAGFALIGFVDDFVVPRLMVGKRGLGWTQKLLMQIAFATLAAWMVQLQFSVANLAVMVFLILFFSNAYNFSDGLDWLAGTLLLCFLAGLAFVFPTGHWLIPAYCLALAAAAIPFMVLNRPPARVFMGDVGSLPIGAFLGLAVGVLVMPALGEVGRSKFLTEAVTDPGLRWALIGGGLVLSFVMIAELVPPPLQIFSVKVFKRKIFPYTPIHHAFQRAGWSEQKVVCLFAAVQIVGSLIAYGWITSARAAVPAPPLVFGETADPGAP